MKKEMSERDICTKYITPAILQAGWDSQRQVREEVTFTDGRIIVQGQKATRAKGKRADYILYHKPNFPIAVIEAKDNNHSIGAGMQQALDYAEILDIPFVYSSNGDGFIEHDRTVISGTIERELSLDEFPSPDELWERYRQWKQLTPEEEEIVTYNYYTEPGWKSPRYYQQIAVNRTLEAIAKGQDRILLVMATGTGKTFAAFQIIWRLWKSRAKKRILFLADRNILVDQTRVNDFKPFGNKMTKIENRSVDKSYEIYLAIYQGVTGTEDHKNIYKQFSPDFFDLIVVDECHRGSAKEESAWREILEYFSSATQIGLTATPKETKEVSNIHYFGKPLYTYSLKQGIEDGFLAPYKVIRIAIDRDVEGWRPYMGKKDKYGNVIEDRVYNVKDFDRNLVIDERTQLVAKKVTEYMKKTDRFGKTIIFCVDIDHAERMRRAMINENNDLYSQNSKYIMRITGDDKIGKFELDNFIDPNSPYPVVATTSKLMTTGVDAKTCKLIVLDANIGSMTEFKQIIGRGTRVDEEHGKLYFTIMDFRKVTNLFADKEFDGDPVQIYEPGPDDPVDPPEEEEKPSGENPDEEPEGTDEKEEIDYGPEGKEEGKGGGTTIGEPPRKYYVNGVMVKVLNERVQYYGKDGKLITESLKDYTKKGIMQEFASLDDFVNRWNSAEKKQAIIDELAELGILIGALEEEVGKDYDPFDLICHVAFDAPPLTRRERANNVKKRNYFEKYGDTARAVLEALLDKYADEGVENIEKIDVLKLRPFDTMGSMVEIINSFGGKNKYSVAIQELEQEIYTMQ